MDKIYKYLKNIVGSRVKVLTLGHIPVTRVGKIVEVNKNWVRVQFPYYNECFTLADFGAEKTSYNFYIKNEGKWKIINIKLESKKHEIQI